MVDKDGEIEGEVTAEADEVAEEVEQRMSALVPVEDIDGSLESAELGSPDAVPPDEDDSEPESEFQRLAVWAQLKRISGAAASNGNAFGGVFEFDAYAAGDAVELVGQQTFKVVFAKVEYGEARIKGIAIKPDEDANARATMTLDWSQNQLTPWAKLVKQIGKGGQLELETVQLELDLTAKA